MRFVEELRGRHEGEEIWVLGSGRSLDDFPAGFFDDKTTIAVNWSAWGLPNATYRLWWHQVFSEMQMLQDPEGFRGCIIGYPTERWGPEQWGKCIDYPTLFKWEINIYRREQLAYNVRRIMHGQTCGYGGFGTTVHAALQIAAVMGAKEITLVGCEHRWDESYYPEDSYWVKTHPYLHWTTEKIERYRELTKEPALFLTNIGRFTAMLHGFLKQTRADKGRHQRDVFGFAQLNLRGTWYFAEEFARYGVNVRRYYHGEGYRRIIEEDGVEHWDVGQLEEWKRRYPLPKHLEGLTLERIRNGETVAVEQL